LKYTVKADQRPQRRPLSTGGMTRCTTSLRPVACAAATEPAVSGRDSLAGQLPHQWCRPVLVATPHRLRRRRYYPCDDESAEDGDGVVPAYPAGPPTSGL